MRAGFIVPSVNVVLEDELREHFPGGSGYSIARVVLGKGTSVAEDLRLFADRAADEAEKLGDAGVDVIAVACMAASVISDSADEGLTSTVSSACGTEVISAGRSAVDALVRLEVDRVEILTPYDEWLHERECTFLTRAGFDVVDQRIAELRPDLLGAMPADVLADVVAANATPRRDLDVTMFSCANARLVSQLPHLSEMLGRPVMSTNSMLMQSVLSALAAKASRDALDL